MKKAFMVGILLSIIIPCIGTTIVLKRLSMIGDALSHASLAGVSAGLIMSINPVLGAIIACILAALSVEAIRKKIPQYSEVSIAIITSACIGLAGVLSGFIKNVTSFNSFLFGSIVAISDIEVKMTIIVSIVVIISTILLYKELMYISFDEESAKLSGVNASAINFVFTILTAITVSVASRTVGALIVSSLMVVPVATSIQVSRSYKQVIIISVLYAFFEVVIGLTMSYYIRINGAGLKPGGTIVLIAVIGFLLTSAIKNIIRK
ncbi:MAG: metal ABC transporter permease [Peptoanaerobacter stomatis]|uniref:metal ABC transporter permease n=1 Tax=Peptoanaerobacter stomatis TaxID=796937 RepID=UPI003F9FAB4D